VHAKGSVIFMQLWHMGRQSHSSYQGGKLPVAPSAIAVQGQAHTADGGKHDYEVQQTRYNALE
jgi:N-ethylmaleimide reductase